MQYLPKQPNLELKTRLNKLLGSLPLHLCPLNMVLLLILLLFLMKGELEKYRMFLYLKNSKS